MKIQFFAYIDDVQPGAGEPGEDSITQPSRYYEMMFHF